MTLFMLKTFRISTTHEVVTIAYPGGIEWLVEMNEECEEGWRIIGELQNLPSHSCITTFSIILKFLNEIYKLFRKTLKNFYKKGLLTKKK